MSVPKKPLICPVCRQPMQKFVPLIFSGEGVTDFRCYNPKCIYEIHVMRKEK